MNRIGTAATAAGCGGVSRRSASPRSAAVSRPHPSRLESGPALLLAYLRSAGWVVGPLVLLWGVMYACNARAWQLLVPDRPPAFTFPRAYLLSVSGFAINYATPWLAVGGEPFKVTGSTPYLGLHRAVGSVVGFRFLHALSHVFVFLTGDRSGRDPPAAYAGDFGSWRSRPWSWRSPPSSCFPSIARASSSAAWPCSAGSVRCGGGRPLERIATLEGLDARLTAVHRAGGSISWGARHRNDGRLICTFEYTIILYGLGLGVDLPRAFVVANVSSLITNLFFFMPFEMGAKEGGSYAVFALLGLDPRWARRRHCSAGCARWSGC